MQKYVLVSTGKKIEDLALNPELALQYADVEMDHEAGTEWILNDVAVIIELMPVVEPVEPVEPSPEV